MTGKGLAITRSTDDNLIVMYVGAEPWRMNADEARELAGTLNEFATAIDLVQAQFAPDASAVCECGVGCCTVACCATVEPAGLPALPWSELCQEA